MSEPTIGDNSQLRSVVERIENVNEQIKDLTTDRSALQKAIRVESLRAELSDLGFTVISTEWLQTKLVAEKIRRRQLEEA